MTDSPSWTDHPATAQLLKEARVLVVEDSRTVRAVLESLLRSQGVQHIRSVGNGAEALQVLEAFAPDLILLDVEMPVMGGLEFCERLRQSNSAFREVPVVVMTALDGGDARLRALNIGVSAILHKPATLESLMYIVCLCLQRSYLLARMQQGHTTSEDVHQAARLQADLLPSAAFLQQMQEAYGLQIRSLYRSSEALGGDYWMVQPVNRHTLAIGMIDFSGHGAAVAVHTFHLHTCLQEYVRDAHSPAEVLAEANASLCRMLPVGSYATGVLGFWNVATRTLIYATAAAPPMLYVDGSNVQPCEGNGDVLGAYADARYVDEQAPLYPHSEILLYSDALVEPNEQEQALFTPASLIAQAAADTRGDAYAAVTAAIGGSAHHFDDDLSLVSVRAAR